MKPRFIIVICLCLFTCQSKSRAKTQKDQPLGCFVNDLPNGFELVCDGVPHQCLNGKDGAQGQAGHNGSPGQKGDKGDPGSGGRSIQSIVNCSERWDGVPAYDLTYLVFLYSDGVKEVVASFQTDKNELSVNSAIWIKEDSRYEQSPVDVGGFTFTKVSDGAVVLYGQTGRTSTMSCH